MSPERDYDRADEMFFKIVRSVIVRVHDRKNQDNVSRALFYLLVRVANTWMSVRTLRKHSPDDKVFMVDAGVLLRCMFDAYLQADCILRDSSTCEETATLYLDFEHVEKFKNSQRILRHDNALTKRLRVSPIKAKGEKRLQEEFDRVKDQYLVEKRQSDGSVRRGPRTRNKWYEGTLHQLAEAAGKLQEYDTFVTPFSGCVHSSAFAVGTGPQVAASNVLVLASTVAARVLIMNIRYNELEIDKAERELVQIFATSWLEEDNVA